MLWRISRHYDLQGIGGLRAAARWHHAGHPIVYLCETPAAALLEVCAHTAANDLPSSFTLLRIEGPALHIPKVEEQILPEHWQTALHTTRELGTAWLRRNDSALLRVPSAVIPYTANFLLNPLHPDAGRFQITETLPYPFDARLKR